MPAEKRRDMNKKIIFLILILLSIFIDVKAAGITINNRYYNATSDIVGNGFKYSISDNTLELDDYNGSIISTLDDLNIIIKGDNYITSNSTLPLIKAKNLVIIGEGSLNVTAPGIAFYADSVDIKNIVVKGSSKTEFISVTNSFILDNVEINAESGTTLLYGGSNNTINNSVINSTNKWGLRYATNGVTDIHNSDIKMECSSICINSTATLTFNNTNALFHGQTYAASKIKMNFDKESNYLVSYDGVSYQENSTYNNFPYLKITGVLDDSINNDKDDENKNDDNVNDNGSLDDSNNNQDDLEDNSSNNGNTSDSIKDNDSTSSDSTSTNDKSDDSTNTDDSINKPSDNVDKDNATNDKEDDDSGNNNSNINQDNNDKLEEDNNPDSDINELDKENDDASIEDVYTDNEYENKEEIYTDNEYDNDWTVEVENPKTYDGIGYKVFWLTFSLAGIVALAFLMRYLNGKI